MREIRQVEDETVKWAMSDVAPMSDEAFERGRAALLARIDADESAQDSGEVVALARRRRRHVPLLAAAAVMLVIAGAALVAPSLISRLDGPSVGSAEAADLLSKAANLTGDAKLRPGQYLQVNLDARWYLLDARHRFLYLQDQRQQTWIPADRAGTWLYRHRMVGDRQWLIGSERENSGDVPKELHKDSESTSTGGPALHDKIDASFRAPSVEYLATVPLDPAQLYEKLRDEAGTNDGNVFMQMVGDGLDSGAYPAEVRSAVYRALSHLPGLEVTEDVAVFDGRRGTAFGVTEGEVTEQLVIDRATGEYLGSRTVLAEDAWGLKEGQVIGTTSVTTKVVAGIGLDS
ncbi:CU044_5270 family protein [Lentzea sp. NPDC055074]